MIAKSLVIGVPRSGFSLLIHVINAILNLTGYQSRRTYHDIINYALVELVSQYITNRYQETFARFGITRDLIFNGEFHLLVGGPKWLSTDSTDLFCVRKYFGVKGMGDFLLVTSHPKPVLEYYPVVHSHTAPALWLQDPYYEPFKKFLSVRNSIGIINSASFSLNAMASEYVQKFMPGVAEESIRQRIALYKLTDIQFIHGLVKFLKNYLDELLPVKDLYLIMKWEDLIDSPAKTIQNVASNLGVSITADEALAIWKPMDHKNLLLHHKHNYRRGSGIVGDWKNSLVNEHMDVFREFDFDFYLKEFGYPPIPELNPREYSPYQTLVARYIQRGEVYRNTGDPDLFGFAFNKSNIDATKFNFKSFPKRQWTHVERSTFIHDHIVEAVSDTAEDACNKINNIFQQVFDADLDSNERAYVLVGSIEKQCAELMNEISNVRGRMLHEQVFQYLYAHCT